MTSIADQAGVTYRQLDYWIRQGYLKPIRTGGTGHQHEWPKTELSVARWMGRLVKAGFTPEAAAELARTALTKDEIELAPGLFLRIDKGAR